MIIRISHTAATAFVMIGLMGLVTLAFGTQAGSGAFLLAVFVIFIVDFIAFLREEAHKEQNRGQIR